MLPHEGTLIYELEKTWKMPRRNCDFQSLSKDQILSTHDIVVTSVHYGSILNLSALLARESSSTIYCRVYYGGITSMIV